MKKWSWLVAPAIVIALAAMPAAARIASGPTGTLSFSGGGSNFAASTSLAKGDTVSLTATYAGTRKQDTVRVQLLCLQDIGVVYGDATTLSGSPQTVSFTLGVNSATATSVWTGGNADCRADLYYIANAGGGTVHYLANLPFSASG
jgi:hypothetical protein